MRYQTRLLLAIGTFWLFFAVLCMAAMLITSALNTEHGKLKTPYPNILDTIPALDK